jgi:hypothetical protein
MRFAQDLKISIVEQLLSETPVPQSCAGATTFPPVKRKFAFYSHATHVSLQL